MEMGKYEIEVLYRQAADRREEIKILAQLNATTRLEIINVLNELGYDIKKPRKKKSFWTDGRLEALVRFIKHNMPYRVIAETLGCSLSTIDSKVRDLKDEGVLA